MSGREWTVGLVGPGAISKMHAAAVQAVEGLKLIAIVGGTPERIAANFGPDVRQFSSVDDMLLHARPDIVVITTPSGEHFAAAWAALNAGCHVVVEKPLAVDPAEAARLAGKAAETGLVCATISQRRFEPAHLEIKRLLEAGALGKLRLIEADCHWWRSSAYYAEKPWRQSTGQGGGSLVNQGIHSVDLLLFFAGQVNCVAAMTATVGHDISVEDLTTALLRFENGVHGTIVTTTAAPPGTGAGLRLFTSAGHCVLDQDAITQWGFADVPKPETATEGGSGASDPMAIGFAGHMRQWTDIRDAIRDGRTAQITFDDGAAAARVCAAIYKAAAERRVVDLAEFPSRLP